MNYYQESEEIGNKLFTQWAEKVNIFAEMKRQPLLSRIDWICKSKKGTVVNCELKVRASLKYDTIFIEIGKYDYLMGKWKEGIVPWYINFCGNETLVFDLRKVKPIRQTRVQIWNHADKCYQWVDRYELPTKQAFRFIDGQQVKS